jgi:hypothetical protein
MFETSPHSTQQPSLASTRVIKSKAIPLAAGVLRFHAIYKGVSRRYHSVVAQRGWMWLYCFQSVPLEYFFKKSMLYANNL